MTKHVRVSIISPHCLGAQAIAATLGRFPCIDAALCHPSVEAFLHSFRGCQTSLAIVDASSHCPNCIERTRRLRLYHPDLGIVAYGVGGRVEHMLSLVEAGAQGFVGKGATAEELVDVIQLVLAGGTVCPPEMTAALYRRLAELARRKPDIPSTFAETLTVRERQVLSLLSSGMGNKAIAVELGVSLSTVKSSVREALRKLRLRRHDVPRWMRARRSAETNSFATFPAVEIDSSNRAPRSKGSTGTRPGPVEVRPFLNPRIH